MKHRGRPVNLDRSLALSEGRLTYQGGKCRKGHKGERYTKNKLCVECAAVHSVEQRHRNKGKTAY